MTTLNTMEETKTNLKVKASVEIYNSPKKSLHPLTATTKSTPASQLHDNDSYLDSFPAGYRFCPFDSELIIYYLKKKIMNERLPPNKINDVNLYQFNPHDLAEMYKGCAEKEKEFYFFTPRDRKYKNGTRPNRAAGEGYWKATGADKSIKHNGSIVGFKKTLVFYEGKPPKGDKTFWIMHEYRVNNDSPPSTRLSTDMRLDDWVLCRIYYKERVDKTLNSLHRKEDRISTQETNEPDCDNGSVVEFSGYADTYSGYMQHFWQQQNAFSQIPSLKDVSFDSIVNMDEPFQHDGTSIFGSDYAANDIFWNAYNQDNICFDQSQLYFSNGFEDTSIIVKSDNSHK